MAEVYQQYELRYGVRFVRKLGDGKDGSVLETADRRAVKFFLLPEIYRREEAAYKLLRELNIDKVKEFHVPSLIRLDDDLLAIEMTIVQPPFLLDFASAYTEEEYFFLDFPEDVINEREQHWADIFGDRWPAVSALRDEFLRLTGLVLLDLNPNNVRFE